MLDECKGDKFEEVLVSLSTIVVQKVLAAEKNENPSIARRFALIRKVPLKDQESLLPLALAHRASLASVLRRKRLLKTRHLEFQHLLDRKEQELSQRIERLEAIEESGAAKFVPNHAIQGIKRHFDIHWQGDPRWVDVIVKGAEHDNRDSALETAFSELWPSLNHSTLHQATAANQQGLLQDLEKRIANQQERLQHWKAVKDNLIRTPKTSSPTSVQVPGSSETQVITLDLSRHEEISLDSKRHCVRGKAQGIIEGSCAPSMTDEYIRLVNSMEAELATVGKCGRKSVKSIRRNGHSISPVPLGDHGMVIEPDHLAGSERDSAQDIGSPSGKPSKLTSRTSLNLPSYHKNDRDAEKSPEGTEGISHSSHERMEIFKFGEYDAATVDSSLELDTKIARKIEDGPSELEIHDEDEILVQRIISSTRNADPSPAKSKRSLVERTRQSMGFSSLEALDDFPDSVTAPLPPTLSNTLDSSPSIPAKSTTLLERTRQSMSLMPSASLKSQKSVHRSRPSKIYPNNQFGTPSKQQTIEIVGEDTTPPERLFTQEADYASVFKSRPKIALSPMGSPEL